jgi:hypothetical protein
LQRLLANFSPRKKIENKEWTKLEKTVPQASKKV